MLYVFPLTTRFNLVMLARILSYYNANKKKNYERGILGTRRFQKAQIGSNERKYCEDGLGTKIYLHRRSRWALLV